MPDDLIRYEALVLDALRGVVRAVMQRVQKRGVPGDHHFFITFDTRAPGVGLSKRLKDQYQQEMTIVLQHQFWDLAVTEDRFEVRLSFNNVPERLVVPFGAVRIFQDPSVHFALALRPPEEEDAAKAGPSGVPEMQLLAPPKPEGAPVHALPKAKQDELAHDPSPANSPGDDSGEKRSAEVVSLDKFRKK